MDLVRLGNGLIRNGMAVGKGVLIALETLPSVGMALNDKCARGVEEAVTMTRRF